MLWMILALFGLFFLAPVGYMLIRTKKKLNDLVMIRSGSDKPDFDMCNVFVKEVKESDYDEKGNPIMVRRRRYFMKTSRNGTFELYGKISFEELKKNRRFYAINFVRPDNSSKTLACPGYISEEMIPIKEIIEGIDFPKLGFKSLKPQELDGIEIGDLKTESSYKDKLNLVKENVVCFGAYCKAVYSYIASKYSKPTEVSYDKIDTCGMVWLPPLRENSQNEVSLTVIDIPSMEFLRKMGKEKIHAVWDKNDVLDGGHDLSIIGYALLAIGVLMVLIFILPKMLGLFSIGSDAFASTT